MPKDVATTLRSRRAAEATRRPPPAYVVTPRRRSPGRAAPSFASTASTRRREPDRAERGVRCACRLARAHDPSVHSASPDEFRASGAVDADAVEEFLASTRRVVQWGVDPLIENVTPVLRMRTGGVYLSPIGGHGGLARLARARSGARVHDRHIARCVVPLVRDHLSRAVRHPWDEELELERYVEELGPHAQVAHVSDAHGLLGRGFPTAAASSSSTPSCRKARPAGALTSPRSTSLIRALGGDEAVLTARSNGTLALHPRSRSLRAPGADRFVRLAAGARASRSRPFRARVAGALWRPADLLTGGGGSIGGALATFLGGFRPERITIVDGHESSTDRDRRGGTTWQTPRPSSTTSSATSASRGG